VNYAAMRGNFLYPYNLIYYGAALIGLVLRYLLFRRKKVAT
jgi:hypothetical protein